MPTKNRWAYFKGITSSVDISKQKTGNANILADWKRAANPSDSSKFSVTINDKPLSEYAKLYNNFGEIKDLKLFFLKVILQGMLIGRDRKNEIVDYLLTTFHQGGFLYPVASAVTTSMMYSKAREYKPALLPDLEQEKQITLRNNTLYLSIQDGKIKYKVLGDKKKESDPKTIFEGEITQDALKKQNREVKIPLNKERLLEKEQRKLLQAVFEITLKRGHTHSHENVYFAAIDGKGTTRHVNITTTTSGFKIQEHFSAKKLFIDQICTPQSLMKKHCNPNDRYLLPDKEGANIIEADGIIDIDFPIKRDVTPSIRVESNQIKFGHSGVKMMMDKRSLGDKIVDFFRNILGLNKVKVLAPELNQPPTHTL